MSDTKWSGWKITEEQRQRMLQGDREALDAFYFDNLPQITRIAENYAYKMRLAGWGDVYQVEDLVQDTYINLSKLSFERAEHFGASLKQSFFLSRFGGMWCTPSVYEEKRRAPPTLYIVDSYMHEAEGDMRTIDRYVSSPSAYQELLAEAELRRKEKLESDLDKLLGELLTPKQFINWKMGYNRPDIIIKLRKNAPMLIEFLRAHGTPSYLLKGEPLSVVLQTDKLRKAEAQALKALRAWQEAHLDELDEKTRKTVLNRIWSREHRSKDQPKEYLARRKAEAQEQI